SGGLVMTSMLERSRWRRAVLAMALLCGLTFVATPAMAQEGQIFGAITDESGAVLPGVTVTVTSPQLLVKEMTSVTDARGEYPITALALGTLLNEFHLSRLSGQGREGHRLAAGIQGKNRLQLKVGGVERTGHLARSFPVVGGKDATTGTQLTRENLEI